MTRNILIGLVFSMVLFLQLPAFGISVPPEEKGGKGIPPEDTVIAQTRKEHLAMAQRYKQKAEQYRAEANFHRQMQEDYKRSVAIHPKSPAENPWIKEMSNHCQQYIQDANQLAEEALKFSEYHLMRAKELEGK